MMRRQGTFQMPFTHSFRLILVLWLVYAEEWLWWQKEDATCCRIGRDGCCPGFWLRFHQVPLSQKSPPCSWPLVCSRHRRTRYCNHHSRYYVRVSFLIQYSLYKNIACFTGQVLPSSLTQKWPKIFYFKVFYMFYSNFSAQVLSGVIFMKIVNIWCCRPFLRAPSLFYTTPSTHQYQVCYFQKNTNVSENSLRKSFW